LDGRAYLELGDFDNALYHQEKAWAGYTKNNTILTGSDKACKMVQLYAIVGNYQKEAQAFQYLTEKCLNFGGFGSTTGYTADGYFYHAWALIRQNRATEALVWLDKTLNINQSTNPNLHRYNHKALLLKVEALIKLQHLDEAKTILQDILLHSPLPDTKKQALAKLADILFKKFKNSSQKVELQQSWNYLLQAFQTLDSMRYTYQSAASRIQQAELNFHLFESALNTSFERQDLENSFWVAEKSKASALLDNQRDDLARRIAGLPDSLLHRESSLKSQIAELEKTVYEKPSGSEKTNAEAALFEKKQSLNTLLQNFEKNYPLYFKFKYNTTLADAKQLQANLPPATAMLEYFVGDSSIFIFSITAQHLQLQRIAKPKDFEPTIQNLRQALTSAELRFLKKDFVAFSLAANKLYQDLLAAPLALLPQGIQHLIIVPDGSLNYVPFEVLGKNAGSNDFKTYPYLLKNFNISYATSANLWLEQIKPKGSQRLQNSALELFAGFAPSYNSSDTLSSINSRTRSLLVRDEQYEIPGAALEVQEIARLLNGKTWLGEAATKSQFRQQAPRFQVLHLAMHSIMDDVNPLFSRLLFTQKQHEIEGNELYANDLYNMRLPTEMVVLSACNTGNGKLRRGEGVMSLSRAFTYTGVPSTVMSLWKAPDESTRTLMLTFYQNLKMGMNKDVALQKAKLSQLASSDASSTNPFFWAGFVASGDMRPLFAR
jgi:CHAT domain-containing protein